MEDQKFLVKSLLETEIPIRKGRYGNLYKLKQCILHAGGYLIKNNNIFKESIHENYNLDWINYWTSKRGNTFGGDSLNDLLILENGKKISILKKKGREFHIKGSAILFQYIYDKNFHHFVCTALPRLAYAINNDFSDIKILLREDTPKYQLDMIKKIIKKNKIIHIKNDESYFCEEILLTTFPQQVSFDVIDNFYVDFFKLKKDTKADDYLFISRERSKKRPILNENEVENFFKKKGFKICFSSQLNIDQRINTFGKAKCLAGVFSAGLANLIFAINCKKIIFIEHPLYSISKEYIKICKKRNIDIVIIKKNKIYKFFYKILSIILSPFRKKTLINTNNSDFWKVDIQNLKKYI